MSPSWEYKMSPSLLVPDVLPQLDPAAIAKSMLNLVYQVMLSGHQSAYLSVLQLKLATDSASKES